MFDKRYLKVSQRVRNEQIILVNRGNGFEVKNRAELKTCVKRVFFYLFQKLHEEDGLSQFSIFELSVFVNTVFAKLSGSGLCGYEL